MLKKYACNIFFPNLCNISIIENSQLRLPQLLHWAFTSSPLPLWKLRSLLEILTIVGFPNFFSICQGISNRSIHREFKAFSLCARFSWNLFIFFNYAKHVKGMLDWDFFFLIILLGYLSVPSLVFSFVKASYAFSKVQASLTS